MKFRKKPVIIDAEQFNPEISEIDYKAGGLKVFTCGVYETTKAGTGYMIDTLEGTHNVTPGDWIITGVKGEKYPCKPDIFEMTYEKVA